MRVGLPKKKTLTTQDKINLIISKTPFTKEELLNLPIETFDKIFSDVEKMNFAIYEVERDIFLYKEKETKQ